MPSETRITRAFDIRDPDIDIGEIVWHIRENIRGRGAGLPKFDPAADDFLWWATGAEPYLTFRDSVAKAESWVERTKVEDQLRTPSSYADRFLSNLRQPLHQLARFYVNLLAERQRVFNLHVIRALKALAPQLKERCGPTASAESIRDQIRALEEQVERLERIVDDRLGVLEGDNAD